MIVVSLADLALESEFSALGGAAEAQRAGQVPGGGPAGPEGVDLVTFDRADVAGQGARKLSFSSFSSRGRQTSPLKETTVWPASFRFREPIWAVPEL